ncbi:hypothetical protein F4780DRAFT_77269 [Xylariomycetidae sp. FL0641]|nr:hypothetical protein F4780DRAFT_77269 [Xylariomycetidae sp. FL0641]
MGHYPEIDTSQMTPEEKEAFLNLPALTPPPGVIPNFDNPPNQDAMVLGVTIFCLVIATIAVAIRAYAKIFCFRKVRYEDGFILIGFAAFLASAWDTLYMQRTIGFYVHQWNIRLKDTPQFHKALFIIPITYAISLIFVKAAILVEWPRFFVPRRTRNAFFWCCYGLILLNTLLYIGVIITMGLYCDPWDKVWHRWAPGHCIDRKILDVCTAAFDFAIDLGILILPQRVIWNLRVSRPKKIGISLVFSLGLAACIAAAGRIYAVAELDYYGDTTYDASSAFVWGVGELTCGLMICCVPAAPKAFSESKLLSRIARSVGSLSFTSRSSRLEKQQNSDASWSRSDPKREHSNAYHELEDPTQVSLEELNPQGPRPVYTPGQCHYDPAPGPDGILRVVEISTYNEPATRGPDNQVLMENHPWNEDRRWRGGQDIHMC